MPSAIGASSTLPFVGRQREVEDVAQDRRGRPLRGGGRGLARGRHRCRRRRGRRRTALRARTGRRIPAAPTGRQQSSCTDHAEGHTQPAGPLDEQTSGEHAWQNLSMVVPFTERSRAGVPVVRPPLVRPPWQRGPPVGAVQGKPGHVCTYFGDLPPNRPCDRRRRRRPLPLAPPQPPRYAATATAQRCDHGMWPSLV